MDLDKQQENKVKELHTNVRHITQLGMGWFAFFVTVNYAAMSWLATNAATNLIVVQRIAAVFILQNLLGVFGLIWVLVAMRAMTVQVNSFENPDFPTCSELERERKKKNILRRFYNRLKNPWTSKKWKSESIPTHLYIAIGVSLMLVLISLIVAWASIVWSYGSQKR